MVQEQVIDSGMQNQAAPVVDTSKVQADSTPPESPTTAPGEKMLPQSQVQSIAAREARKAEERAEARVRAEYEAKMSQNQQTQQQQAQPQNVGGIPQVSNEHIQQLIRQEASNMAREHQAIQIEQNWKSAMDAERQADPEFAELYDALGIEAQPGLIIAMAGMENKGKVVKDLAQNPTKYANILMLANSGSPKLAYAELNKLSQSIKANEEAKKQPKVEPPLGQIKASNIGGDDGNQSVSDFRKKPWLRG